MVGFSTPAEKTRVMVGLRWLISSFLPLILVLDPSSALRNRERLYGDISEDEVAIDHLEDLLQTQEMHNDMESIHGPHPFETNIPNLYSALKIGEKIDFAVPPSDPRYILPSSVLRDGPASLSDYVPSEDMMRKSSDLRMKGVEMQPQNLFQELYTRYGHLVDGGQKNGEDFQGRERGFYRGHKFGPNPPPPPVGEAETLQPESVNYLQESRHEAESPGYYVQSSENGAVLSDFYFVALVSGCTAAAVCAVVGAGICYFRLHKNKRDAADAEYPAYGVTGPCKDISPAAADRKLAQSAHMFHYQHQKQQMIALEKSSEDGRRCSTSDVDSEEEGEEGDYTVYECPGLAPTGEMEVTNPLFSDDPTPATPARPKTNDVRKDDNDDDDD